MNTFVDCPLLHLKYLWDDLMGVSRILWELVDFFIFILIDRDDLIEREKKIFF